MALVQFDPQDLTGTRLATLPPLALYVHVPWCVRKCPYCDFNSHEWRDSGGAELPEADYEAALIADLDASLGEVWGRRIETIFFGGGTPSLLGAATIDRLLSAFRARLNVSPEVEVTLEANPGTFEAQKYADFSQAGVNRLSIGVQSFDNDKLKALGRIHDALDARRAIDSALKSIGNVNIDLMYALPGQSLDEAQADISVALATGVPHLSAYHLTLEPNTYFYRHPPVLPDEEQSADIQEMVAERLGGAGLEHYETSAHARPGARCRHNLNYWQFGDYLGIGAGAHSKISFPDRITRSARVKLPRDYMRRAWAATGGESAVQSQNRVARSDLAFEFMMNALRLNDGFELARFTERTGLALSAIGSTLERAQARGLVVRDLHSVRPTPLGQRFLNDLLQMFLPTKSH